MTATTPVLRLTLDHCLPASDGTWVRVTSILVDGPHVVVRVGDDRPALRLPRAARVRARLADEILLAEDHFDVDAMLAGWYAGDVTALRGALIGTVDEPAQRVPVPLPAEVAAYCGGDLDALIEAVGGIADAEAAALRASLTATRSGLRECGGPPAADDDDALTDRMGGHFGGDLSAFVSDAA